VQFHRVSGASEGTRPIDFRGKKRKTKKICGVRTIPGPGSKLCLERKASAKGNLDSRVFRREKGKTAKKNTSR